MRLLPVAIAISVLHSAMATASPKDADSKQVPPPVYELYSWQPEAKDTWHFALLYSTSRMKRPDEIFKAPTKMKGVDAVEERISALASGSIIYWFGGLVGLDGKPIKGTEALGYPPSEIIDRVRHFGEEHGIAIRGDGKTEVFR